MSLRAMIFVPIVGQTPKAIVAETLHRLDRSERHLLSTRYIATLSISRTETTRRVAATSISMQGYATWSANHCAKKRGESRIRFAACEFRSNARTGVSRPLLGRRAAPARVAGFLLPERLLDRGGRPDLYVLSGTGAP